AGLLRGAVVVRSTPIRPVQGVRRHKRCSPGSDNEPTAKRSEAAKKSHGASTPAYRSWVGQRGWEGQVQNKCNPRAGQATTPSLGRINVLAGAKARFTTCCHRGERSSG